MEFANFTRQHPSVALPSTGLSFRQSAKNGVHLHNDGPGGSVRSAGIHPSDWIPKLIVSNESLSLRVTKISGAVVGLLT